MRVLLELRPAFSGNSGIPQETRLLFSGLLKMDGVDTLGLIQSGNLVVERGIRVRNGLPQVSRDTARDINRLSGVVSSLQQGSASHRFEHLRKRALKAAGPALAALGGLVGITTSLTAFDPTHFRDFIWRAMFAPSLPTDDFDAVTRADYRIMRWPWSLLNAIGVATSWLGHATYPVLDTSGIDVMIAETPYPGRVRHGTRLIVRYHDAIPLLMPHTVKDRGYHRALHYQALSRNASDGAWFACVSETTRTDLLSVMPELAPRSLTIPNMISHHYRPEAEPADRVPEIVWSRKNRQAIHGGGASIHPTDVEGGQLSYLLVVSTIEPRKNHLALLDAWELLRTRGYPRLNLVLVGSMGWDHDGIMRRLAPWLERGGVHLLENVPPEDLRLLYRHASATVCPSLAEGFDFSGVEAMRSLGVVAASDIDVHREVYANACEYFNPYSSEDMYTVIDSLISPKATARREALREAGAAISARYTPETVMPMWEAFLRQIA